MTHMQCIFGLSNHFNPIIWLTNFGIYKAHLQVCSSLYDSPLVVVKLTFHMYSALFPVLSDFNFT